MLLACGVIGLPAAGCGGFGPDQAGQAPSGTVLFPGPAAGLLPHEPGRVVRFRSIVDDDDRAVTEWESAAGPSAADGGFTVAQRFADGSTARIDARDTGEQILVERIAGSDGTNVTVDPPAILVRTPVIAGDAIETSLARTLSVVFRAGDAVVRGEVAFVGRVTRVPLALDTVVVDGRRYSNALLYRVHGRASGRIDTPVGDVGLVLEVDGEQHLAPGVGVVLETERLVLAAGSGRSEVRVRTERLAAP